MTSYLFYRGMSTTTVGMLRGISSAIGLLGTVAFKYSVQRTSLATIGMWSIVLQFAFISFSMVSMFIKDYRTSMILFVGGVCMSRIGLYLFKISGTQLMQEHIPEHIRGAMGGTQNSLNAFFQLSSFLLCLIYTNPIDFTIVVAAGYIAVAIASTLYLKGIYSCPEYHSEQQLGNKGNSSNSSTQGQIGTI
jgi:solute carrier family 40 (iron-regulated transporter), member 1